ncbi:MAG: cytochrome c [Sphingomonas sp.]
MRIATLALAASAMLLASAVASANGGPDSGADAAGVIAGRQAGMRMSGAIIGEMKAVIDSAGDVKTQGFAARSLAGWAKAIPGMFPLGSGGAPSGALAAVWTDRAGFEAKAAAYAAAAARLADLAKVGDAAGFAAQWGEVRAACGACHETYKKPDPH